ncbi:MAG: SRPBCC family protein [Solirubrobacterales bacterium]
MADSTIVITRVLSAPRQLVFDAWTDPEQMKRWYGPSVFANSECVIDARPGGKFLIVMVSPDGNEYPTGGEFIEVVAPERLVYRETSADLSEAFARMVRQQLSAAGSDPDQDTASTVTVTFDEHDDGTLVTIHTEFPTEAVRDAVAAMQMEAGWNESLDTLERVLAAT